MTIRTQLASLILIAGAFFPSILHAAQTTPTAPTALDKSIDLSVGDHVKVHTILTTLQQAVAKHDAAAVASLIHYPIKVNPGKKPFTIKNEKSFIKDYDGIITHDIQDAILKQKYENLFVNSQGAMIGDGEVWITGFCRDKSCKQSDIKIGTIQDTKNLKP
jgi:hypothetical protein